MENVDATSVQTCTDSAPKKDLPNFGAWRYENLVSYATQSYVLLQQQNEQLEQARLDFKDAMKQLREQLNKDDWK